MKPPEELTTEAVNPESTDLDGMSSVELVRLMNVEDAAVVCAVGAQAEAIAAVIEAVADRLRDGGRLFYVGAGTSGRLGVLDASECPPTFNSDPEMVQGVIAGGDTALRLAAEGAEDDPDRGAGDLRARDIGIADAVIGIAASGTTPYVLGGVEYAASVAAFTAAITCNEDSPLAAAVAAPIPVVVGPEILAGSTRLKAGTATKMVLNMISTGVMVRLGKTFGNLMVDLQATNEKLRGRSRRLLVRIGGIEDAAADALLARCDGDLKTSILIARLGLDPAPARALLAASGGHLREALQAGNS